ncbi:hypothetical protein [Spirosoma agri]|uniref:Uncharacterized protein n=1 Tax=Spirosoma agri TaxID=1987381 RepID=A0A6M0IT66_9BACT|nr:hypothetical protein [Spirosoma agri]NEU70811.1 hypothetical protein [Spirosoma agri]
MQTPYEYLQAQFVAQKPLMETEEGGYLVAELNLIDEDTTNFTFTLEGYGIMAGQTLEGSVEDSDDPNYPGTYNFVAGNADENKPVHQNYSHDNVMLFFSQGVTV